ncbi:MAG: recombinase family protein [Clostridia bacterium]|nr:recombinase family protein [Clostridia bacterium]
MKTAVIYARYSSDKQTEQSIEGQLRECTEYARRNKIIVVDTYIDRATTGTNDNRAAFQKMMKICEKQAWDYILVYKLDRFSRNKYEMAIHRKTLRDNDIKLVSVKENIPDSPEGIILESLLEGMAEYYSAELSQKVKRGMRESRLKGYYTGGHIPYGYMKVGRKLEIDPEKATIVNRIFQEYVEGKMLKEIGDNLTKEGILHLGKPFTLDALSKLVKNEKYTGVMHLNGEAYENIYPRIIDDELFYLAKQTSDANRYGKHNGVIYLLKKRMFCGYCGALMTSESGTSENHSVMRYYKCKQRKLSKPCQKSTIRKEVIEDIVVDTTLKVLQGSFLDKLADDILRVHTKRSQEQATLKLLMVERNETNTALDNLISAMEKGIVSKTTQKRLEELENKLEAIDSKIIVEESKTKIRLTKGDILKFIKKALKKDPYAMIRLLVNKIILYDDKIEIYYNYIENYKPDDNHQAFLFYKEFADIGISCKSVAMGYIRYNATVELFI